jgi:exodeoxyribonuclease V gamma subunit
VPTLPYRVADRAVTEDNAVAQALLTVLELVTARVGASAVLDLLARAPVRDRFELSASDLADLPGWVLGTGISWGIDAEHRQQLIDLDDASHTWQAGLDRLVLGTAMPDDGTRMVAGVVPYDDVEGGAVHLLGKLTGATDALFTSLRSLRDPRPVDDWRQALDQVVDRLLDPGTARRRTDRPVGRGPPGTGRHGRRQRQRPTARPAPST